MKYIKLGMILCVLVALFPKALFAQSTSSFYLKAVVVAKDGAPVEGALIRSSLDSAETVSDSSGSFSLMVSSNARLTVAAEGFVTKFQTVNRELKEIVLEPYLDNRVNVAFRSVEEKDLPGAVSYVDISELLEKNYFTYPFDNMEAFVPGLTGNLWGMDGILILVDGVPRDISSIMTMEIDHVTFLKGISAVALYGSRAAKGVVLVTTKRGVAGKQTINVRANGGLLTPRRYPNYLGSAEYMALHNEARINDGLGRHPNFTDEAIYNHAAGTNPYRYPDVDYYSPEYLKDSYNYYDANVEIGGGGERAQYYTNFGFVTEGSLLNFGEAANSKTERFNVRGNVDMKLNNFITAKVDAAAIFSNLKGANGDFWGGADTLRPHRFAPLIPLSMIEESDVETAILVRNSQNIIDGKYLLGGTQLDPTNPIAASYAGGSSSSVRRQFQFNTGVDADLNGILKGLSFSSLFGIDYNTTYTQSFNHNYATYGVNWTNYAGEDMVGSLEQFGQDASTRAPAISNSLFRQILSISGQLNYQNQVNDVHNLSAMLTGWTYQQTTSSEYRREGSANLGLYLGYNFKDKYYADFSGAYIHSPRLPEGGRQAFSPTFSLGWRLSEEGLLASSSVVDNLKLSVSAGILHTDMDIDDFFLYDNLYEPNGSYFGWNDGSGLPSTESRRGRNSDLTFAKREEVNIGLEAALYNNLITLNGTLFVSKMTGLVDQLENLYPNYFSNGWPPSSFIPYVNYNNDLRSGFDFNVNVNKRLGTVNWKLGVTGTYYTTEALKRAEIVEDDYQLEQGRPLDAIWGLQSNGFFTSQEEISTSPAQPFGSKLAPGDIKYVDQNGDGLINEQDQIYLGRGGWFGSPLTMGVHLTADWKNFTLFALGIARSGANAMKDNDYFWVDEEDKYSEVVRDRWTEATQSTAAYPRLTSQSGENNFRNSDFWIYSTNRFDLARIQVSYKFPESIIGRGFVRGLGIYLSGANLLTIAPNKEILEINLGGPPQVRRYNLGVTAQF